ncbi:MAG: D-alanyl-D-alanine carboxypeptidase [Firmicutes bacterium]|nr:D-alanyl-D-alanine carboxypeptidase [Bacillota bacterium]
MIKRVLIAFCIVFILSTPCFAEETRGSYILMESDTRQIIKKENENARLPIASTTKIMTAVIALENAAPDDIFTVSQNAQNQEGSSIYLREGDRISVSNLLYGLMLNSGNDTAVALAEGVSGSTDAFCNLMNKKAREIGCKNTNFKNPNGLNEEGHYSTAYDMALIMVYAMKNEELSKIMSTKRYNIDDGTSITYLKNHNKLLWQYEYCTGGKTGYTKASGRCLVTSAEKDGIRLVAVTLNCPDDWKEHTKLFDYGFETVKDTKVIEKGSILATKTINGKKVNLIAAEDAKIPLADGKKCNITGKIYLKEKNSDIQIGDNLGYAKIYYNNYPVTSVAIKSGQRVKKAPFSGFSFIKKLISKSTQHKTVTDFELRAFGI